MSARRCTSATAACTRCAAPALAVDPGRGARARRRERLRASRRCSRSSRARSRPTPATSSLAGRPAAFRNPTDALRAGIATVTQETTLAPDLSIAENVFLGHRHGASGGPLIDWRGTRRRAFAALGGSASTSIRRCRCAGFAPTSSRWSRSRARSRSTHASSILDEPTSSLTDDEVAALFGLVRKLRARGCRDDLRLASAEGGLRARRSGHRPPRRPAPWREALDRGARPAEADPPDGRPRARGDRAAGGAGAGRRRRAARPRPDAAARLRRGRSRGRAGRDRRARGARRRRPERAARGAVRAPPPERRRASRSTGRQVAFKHPRQSIRSGVAFVPADRKLQGLVLEMSVRENLVMASTSRLSRAAASGRAARAVASCAPPSTGCASARTRRACRSPRSPAATSRRSCSGSGWRPSRAC